MRILRNQKQNKLGQEWNKRTVLESDYDELIRDDVLMTDENDKPILLYKKLKTDARDIRWALKNIKYGKTERAGGLVTHSRVFGFMPRIEVRNDFC